MATIGASSTASDRRRQLIRQQAAWLNIAAVLGGAGGRRAFQAAAGWGTAAQTVSVRLARKAGSSPARRTTAQLRRIVVSQHFGKQRLVSNSWTKGLAPPTMYTILRFLTGVRAALVSASRMRWGGCSPVAAKK